jgi:hypothetical protein
MARAWAQVPEYEASLDRVLGPGSLPRLLETFDRHVEQMCSHARRLFAQWLDATVGAAQAGASLRA